MPDAPIVAHRPSDNGPFSTADADAAAAQVAEEVEEDYLADPSPDQKAKFFDEADTEIDETGSDHE